MALYPEKSNPFHTDDFEDDSWEPSRPRIVSPEERLQMMKEDSMNSAMESTRRALASIDESERMGMATAEELVQQGEQLDNVERKVTNINQDMKTSQRHINNIKSIFGGIKNWWSGNKAKEDEQEVKVPPRSNSSQLHEALERERERPHPVMRRQETDMSAFHEEPEQTASYSSSRQAYEAQLDNNLDDMSSGIGRLKSLALGLGGEIEQQSTQIDRINQGVDRANIRVTDQNRQMKHILK